MWGEGKAGELGKVSVMGGKLLEEKQRECYASPLHHCTESVMARPTIARRDYLSEKGLVVPGPYLTSKGNTSRGRKNKGNPAEAESSAQRKGSKSP